MENIPETKQEARVLNSIASHYDEWVDLDTISQDASLYPGECMDSIKILTTKRLIDEDVENQRYKLLKSGRHYCGILTWDEKLEIFVKEHKATIWLVSAIVMAALAILTIALSI